MKVDQKWVFEQFINHMTMNCSKSHFWSTFISSNWTKSEFSISLKADQKLVRVTWSLILKRNWGGSKVTRHAYASRDSPPSHTLLDQKLDPRAIQTRHRWERFENPQERPVWADTWFSSDNDHFFRLNLGSILNQLSERPVGTFPFISDKNHMRWSRA